MNVEQFLFLFRRKGLSKTLLYRLYFIGNGCVRANHVFALGGVRAGWFRTDQSSGNVIFASQGFLIRTASRSGADQKPLASEDEVMYSLR